MKVWKLIAAAGVACMATAVNASPLVTYTQVSSPAAGLLRYIFTATRSGAETNPNAFDVSVASGAMQVWKTTLLSGKSPTLDKAILEGWGPDTANGGPGPSYLDSNFDPGGNQMLYDTMLLEASASNGGHIFTSPLSTETNDQSKNGVYAGDLGVLKYGSGSYAITLVALSPNNGPVFDFFQLVILESAGPVTITGHAASPGFGNTAFSFTVNEEEVVPVPAALPLGAAGLGLLALVRRRMA